MPFGKIRNLIDLLSSSKDYSLTSVLFPFVHHPLTYFLRLTIKKPQSRPFFFLFQFPGKIEVCVGYMLLEL